jgi:hypothetical protein
MKIAYIIPDAVRFHNEMDGKQIHFGDDRDKKRYP